MIKCLFKLSRYLNLHYFCVHETCDFLCGVQFRLYFWNILELEFRFVSRIKNELNA